jgi:hypothetical protein
MSLEISPPKMPSRKAELLLETPLSPEQQRYVKFSEMRGDLLISLMTFWKFPRWRRSP